MSSIVFIINALLLPLTVINIIPRFLVKKNWFVVAAIELLIFSHLHASNASEYPILSSAAFSLFCLGASLFWVWYVGFRGYEYTKSGWTIKKGTPVSSRSNDT